MTNPFINDPWLAIPAAAVYAVALWQVVSWMLGRTPEAIEPGAILTDAEIEALFAARTPDTQEAASRQKDQLVHGEATSATS